MRSTAITSKPQQKGQIHLWILPLVLVGWVVSFSFLTTGDWNVYRVADYYGGSNMSRIPRCGFRVIG